MKPLPLTRIAQWTNGRQIDGCDVLIDAIETDTRTLDASDGRAALFIALKGANFDGHDHVAAAAELGARAALVSREVDASLPQVVVADTEHALGALAAALHRGRSGKVVGITGSNGKTTVKTLTASILARLGATHANPGNRNNEIGLPLAVLDLRPEHRYAVFEMGAGKPGDIAWLAAIARPDIGLVNNIAPAHLERMGSLDGIAQTKGALYEALPADGVAIINADDAYADRFARQVSAGRVLRFALDGEADISGEIQASGQGTRFHLRTPQGEGEVDLPMPGAHNVMNALAAAAIASALDAPFQAIRDGLESAQGVAGRLRLLPQPAGHSLIDDTYNANPSSVRAAIDTVVNLAGEPWLVLGDMGELGPDAEALHADIGGYARERGIARLYTLGTLSRAASEAFGADARHFEDRAALVAQLRQSLAPGVICLVKGSRSAGMERVLAELGGGGLDHAA